MHITVIVLRLLIAYLQEVSKFIKVPPFKGMIPIPLILSHHS
jgi:hypothetical protein